MYGVFTGHVMVSFIYDQGYEQLIAVARYLDPMFIPFFAILTGAFFSRGNTGFRNFAWLKFGQRMFPVYFYLLLIIPFYFMFPLPGRTAMDSLIYAPLYLFGIPWLSWTSWFLVALFTAELMYYFIQPHAQKNRLRLVLLAVVFYSLAWLYNHYKLAAPPLLMATSMFWMLHASLLFCAYFLVGALLRPHILAMARWSWQRVLLSGGAAALVCWLGISRNSFAAPAADNAFLHDVFSGDMIVTAIGQYGHYLWFMLSALGAPLAFLCACRLLPVNRLMRACGDHSLVLLGLNGVFLNVLNIRLTGFFIPPGGSLAGLLLYSMLIALVSMAICLPIAKILEKYLPQLTGRPMLKGPLLPALYRKPH